MALYCGIDLHSTNCWISITGAPPVSRREIRPRGMAESAVKGSRRRAQYTIRKGAMANHRTGRCRPLPRLGNRTGPPGRVPSFEAIEEEHLAKRNLTREQALELVEKLLNEGTD